MPTLSPETEYYFQRFGFGPARIMSEPDEDLGMIVVIPCYNEPNLLAALRSLEGCARPACAVEIIVVLNAGETAPPEVVAQNERTARESRAWTADHTRKGFAFHWIECNALPAKKAGVGLARKIGMDEALRRLDSVRRLDGVIVGFDADCVCDANYMREIERFFRANRSAPGAAIYFEHPLEGPDEPGIYEAITAYELHLRYYVEGLRYARFPHAFHTVGSSMAVRAEAYRQEGGMNKRQAGEDFYFLHKIIPRGGFGEINGTRVMASPRPSDRVPFGTGRAVRSYLQTGVFESYPLPAFEDLRLLFQQVNSLYGSDGNLKVLPEGMGRFLQFQQCDVRLEEMRKHSASAEAFEKRFFRWFDGFLAMKYIHFARDNQYGSAPIFAAAQALLALVAREGESPANRRELLLAYRNFQRAGGCINSSVAATAE